jgi:hypothetical protein
MLDRRRYGVRGKNKFRRGAGKMCGKSELVVLVCWWCVVTACDRERERASSSFYA